MEHISDSFNYFVSAWKALNNKWYRKMTIHVAIEVKRIADSFKINYN